MKTRQRLSILGAVVGVALGASLPAAIAAPTDPRGGHVEFERFEDAGTEQLSGQDLGCPQISGTVTRSYDVTGLHKATARGRDGLVHFLDAVHGTETFSANGHTFTHEFNAVFRDHKVVDEGDTLLITGLAAGFDRYSLDGDRLFLDTGTNRVQFRVDHAGTPTDPSDDPEDSFEFLGVVKPSTGRNDTQDRDFCADLIEFLDLTVVP